MLSASSLYAAIDLGSNSFHMLVVREVSGSIRPLQKLSARFALLPVWIKITCCQPTRCRGAGNASDCSLNNCRIFPDQIRVVATATLRLAANAQTFLNTAQQILGCTINVISGEEEARLIYQGVAHTTGGSDQRLVVDIGGGSTELATGDGSHASVLFSLSMGCVTWLERFFSDRHLAKRTLTVPSWRHVR